MSEVHDTLVRVRERLSDPRAWMKGHWAVDEHGLSTDYASPEACAWCLLGAIVVELPDVTSDLYPGISDALDAHIPPVRGSRSSIVSFNDRPSTAHRHILEALDKAIEATA